MSVLRHALMIFVLFPFSLLAVYEGGVWPLVFFAAVIAAHILIDNLTPPQMSVQGERFAGANNFFLLMQAPAAAVLVVLMMMKINPYGVFSQTLQDWTGLSVAGFSSGWELVFAVIATGFMFGGNIIVAHELMHRKGRFWPFWSRVLLIMTGDSQFQEAHIFGHHVNIGTPRDPATARRGESLYNFILRSTFGQYKESFLFERERVKRSHYLVGLMRNRVITGLLGSLLILAFSLVAFGWVAAVAYLIVMIYAKVLLESVNYIQHYGLVRVPGSRVQPHHSWDCHTRGCSMILYNLPRHSDHHAKAQKAFWDLEPGGKSPILRHGYMFTLLVAFVPSLWFRYMQPALDYWDEMLASDDEKALLAPQDMVMAVREQQIGGNHG